MTRFKNDILYFRELVESTDISLWTPEKFSEINAMFTMIEEEIMETEREYAELMSELKDFKEILAQFRKKYFEISL